MKTFKTNDETIKTAVSMLKTNNAAIANATKQIKAAKETIAAWLTDNRQTDIASLPIGELVQIDGLLLIAIGKQNKFNQKRFAVEQPQLFESFKEDVSTITFKPLI